MWRTEKRQIRIFKWAFYFCYWAGILFFLYSLQITTFFDEIQHVPAEYIYVSMDFFSELFEKFKYAF